MARWTEVAAGGDRRRYSQDHAGRAGTRAAGQRTLVLIGNPQAGHGRGRWDHVQRAIARGGLQILEILGMDDLSRLPAYIAQPDATRPLIVAAGGDGTVGAVASYLAHSRGVLGIVPLGTSNDVARSFGIPMHVEKAVHLLTAGTIVTTDLGRIKAAHAPPRYFVHAAAMGIDVAFARLATQPTFRKRLGHFAYTVAALLALRDRIPFQCEVQLGERRLHLNLLHLSVINAPSFGGRFALRLAGSSPDDQRLDVLAIEDGPLLRMLFGTLLVLLGIRPGGRGVRIAHVRRLHVHADQSVAISLDGEVVGRLPSEFTLAPAALRVMAAPEGRNGC